MNKAKKILSALQDHLNLKSFKALAAFLEINESLLYSWVRHNNITGTGKILAKLPYINLAWLETGTGPMMIIDQDNIHLLPESQFASPPGSSVPAKLVARIEPGSEEVKNLLARKAAPARDDVTFSASRGEQQGEEETPVSQMLVMTAKVLESNTVYRSALASNVRAFYQAVIQEDEMQAVNEKLAAIQAENRNLSGQVGAMAEQMARLEQMVASLGAAVPEKREAGGR